MSTVRFQIAVSLDGYAAGPDQSEDNPLGVGGMDLHRWAFELEAWRKRQIAALDDPSKTPKRSELVIRDDQIRESLEGAQLKQQRVRAKLAKQLRKSA